ncbi:MAG: hypothetical protein R3F37_01465 [Candidatus Competibacteraceae bacterium]
MEIYPVVAFEEMAKETLLEICKKRHLKNWSQRSSKSELVELLNADKKPSMNWPIKWPHKQRHAINSRLFYPAQYVSLIAALPLPYASSSTRITHPGRQGVD